MVYAVSSQMTDHVAAMGNVVRYEASAGEQAGALLANELQYMHKVFRDELKRPKDKTV